MEVDAVVSSQQLLLLEHETLETPGYKVFFLGDGHSEASLLEHDTTWDCARVRTQENLVSQSPASTIAGKDGFKYSPCDRFLYLHEKWTASYLNEKVVLHSSNVAIVTVRCRSRTT